MDTQHINIELKIVKLGTQKFKSIDGYYQPKGFALKHPELGYLSFDKEYPYSPKGGKKAIQNIIDAGGFLNFDNCTWLHEMN